MQSNNERPRDGSQSSLQRGEPQNSGQPKVLLHDADLIRFIQHFFTADKAVASICHGIEILATADVLRGRKVTTIPKCRFDATVCGAEYVEDLVVRCGNLICARGKKDMSPWMQQFVPMIEDHLARMKTIEPQRP